MEENEFKELMKMIKSPSIKDFKIDRKSQCIVHPFAKEKQNRSEGMFLYSITIGHLWVIDMISKHGYGEFLVDIFEFASKNKCNLIEWTIDACKKKELDDILAKYGIRFEEKIVRGLDVNTYKDELINLKTKNHPYNVISRYLHMLGMNKFPVDSFSLKKGDDIELFFTEKDAVINAMYLGFKMTGQVEDDNTMNIPEDIKNILIEESPCMTEYKELKYYPKFSGQIEYISELTDFYSQNWDCVNPEQKVVLSKFIYSLRILSELSITLIGANGILSSIATRVLFDNYWQTKYLIEKNEIQKYQEYALDRLRLHILKRTDRTDISDIDILMMASESDLLEPIPIHGDYFKESARVYCIELGIKDDYDKYYEYNSEFIHASLTAVLSGLMVECSNPEHMPHLTINPGASRYINSLPHIYELVNKHIHLINEYLGYTLLENLKFEDHVFSNKDEFRAHMKDIFSQMKDHYE